MNNEILEISKWLHEKGFECDMWACECHEDFDNSDYLVLSSTKIDIDHIEPEICTDAPYFTLNRALELLPESIESFDLEFSKRREYLAYVKHVSDSEIYYHKCQVTWIRKREIDYHLAALRLLKKVVEEGYVKVN